MGTSPYLKGVKRKRAVGGKPSSWGADAVERSGRKHANVVFDLGTNDGSARELKKSIRRVRKATDGQITMLTVHGPDAKRKNALLKRLASRGKIQLVEANRPDGGDGIHYSGSGYKKRARLLNRTLKGAGGKATVKKVPTPPSNDVLKQYVQAKSSTTTYSRKRKRDYGAEARRLRS